MKKDLAFIILTPPSGCGNQPRITRFIFQNGRELENYVQEFINCIPWATGYDLTLIKGFWIGLDNRIRLVMPMTDSCWMLESYINFALWIVESTFTVSEVAANLKLSPPIAPGPTYSPIKSTDPKSSPVMVVNPHTASKDNPSRFSSHHDN